MQAAARPSTQDRRSNRVAFVASHRARFGVVLASRSSAMRGVAHCVFDVLHAAPPAYEHRCMASGSQVRATCRHRRGRQPRVPPQPRNAAGRSWCEPEDRRRYSGTSSSVVDVGIRPGRASPAARDRTAGASMTKMFTSPLAPALSGFLEFRRRRGYRYNRAEVTQRAFDRFVAEYAKHDALWRLDTVILAWLGSRPGRLAVSVSQDMAVIRQFWFYLRRHHPARCRREVRWPKLPTTSSFVPHVLTDDQVRVLLRLA